MLRWFGKWVAAAVLAASGAQAGKAFALPDVGGSLAWTVPSDLSRFAALLLLVAACTHAPPEPPAPQAPASSAEIAARMTEHFGDAAEIENAILIGEYGTVNEVSAAFVERHEDDQPQPSWEPYQSQMLEAAEHTAAAPDLDATLLAVSHFAASCGACHRAQQAKVELGKIHDPDPASDTMFQYRGAVDSMWRGLIGPSDKHWRAGVGAYADVVTCTNHADPSADPHSGDACNSILAAAASASAAVTDEARISAFAAVVGSCARCHSEDGTD